MPPADGSLRRTLTFWDGIGVSVGIMIGSGIFASPGVALQRCGSAGSVLLAWIGAAFLVLCASFCYAELAAMLPDAGGDFAYLKRAYGEVAAFSFAWCNFWIGKTGSQAIIATIFGRYIVSGIAGETFADSLEGAKTARLCSVSLIVLLCFINCSGVRESATLLNILTSLKLILVLSLFVASMIFVFSGHYDIIATNLSPSHTFEGTNAAGVFTGMVACLWAYDGWADMNFMAEELINPEKELPRVVFLSIVLVAVSYVTANIAYFSVLDLNTIETTQSIAVHFGKAVSGRTLASILSLGVALSTTGSANGSILTGGRALYAVARAGRAPASLAALNRNGTPWIALLAQMSWTIVLLCIPGSSFSTLLDYFGPASWFFYALTGFGVIILRYKEPFLARPFRCPFYPLPPIVLCLLSTCLVGTSIASSPFFTSLAFAFLACSVPVYFVFFNLSSGGGTNACSRAPCGVPNAARAVEYVFQALMLRTDPSTRSKQSAVPYSSLAVAENEGDSASDL